MLPAASATSSLRWFCLRSQAKREHIAAANLRDRVEVEVFAPRIRAMHSTRHGIVVNATEALFPGYLFARFAYPDQVRHVLSTNGVTGVVAFGGQPPPIADHVIDCLRHEIVHAERSPVAPVLEEGAWVRILSGCFRFLEGRVIQFDPRTERVRLLLTLLGSEVQVSLTSDRVALLETARTTYPSGLAINHAESSDRVRCIA
jgi:transcriptional antiterminator RfaH